MKRTILLCFLFVGLLSCKDKKEETIKETKPETTFSTKVKIDNPYVSNIEKAYQKKAFLTKAAVTFDVSIVFGGNEILNGKALFSTDSSNGILKLNNGDTIVFSQQNVYHSPDAKNTKMIRFHAYTWHYFFMFPYKLSDQGTVWSFYPNSNLNGKNYDTKKLSFKANTGDAPDDWYVVYANPETHLIDVVAYIVTAGKTKEAAEDDPHAIKYQDFKTIKNIPVAHKWTFWEWHATKGLTKQIGMGIIKNVEFIDSDAALFEIKDNYIKI
ncbi:hypothetical protein KFZ70_17010 [Tamlana fucoidanivorans]|uniref:Heat-shock protein Hsp90 n=1 Tax=Allotamlana fucoidanivorans TaxID=2583814 RepID=A0A5C4SJG3_9FLAO|nr:DUF6503 family protein [Tamlana fucoidanivorans]TNJ43497.1 hypothetical protein FGF67_11300 [Tamlana fucoidanivorans]